NDIVGELKRQLDSLQRQAKKAERYREIRNQVKELDLILSSHRWMEFKTDLESVQAQLAEAQTGEVEAQAHISTLESQVQQMRLDLAELEKKVNTLQTQRFESQSEVQKKESEIQRLEMQIEQARQNEVMTGNLLQEL